MPDAMTCTTGSGRASSGATTREAKAKCRPVPERRLEYATPLAHEAFEGLHSVTDTPQSAPNTSTEGAQWPNLRAFTPTRLFCD